MSKLFDQVAGELVTDKDYRPTRDKDYLAGMKACEDGESHDMTRSLEYTDGYGRQYALMEEMSHREATCE